VRDCDIRETMLLENLIAHFIVDRRFAFWVAQSQKHCEWNSRAWEASAGAKGVSDTQPPAGAVTDAALHIHKDTLDRRPFESALQEITLGQREALRELGVIVLGASFPLGLAGGMVQNMVLLEKLLKKGTLKTYDNFPHGMPTTQAETINADLLTFLKA